MPTRPWLVESDKPSYQVLKWIGGGGFGQVFKVLRNGHVVACKQVQLDDAEAALDEYDHMKSLRGAPHIATLHDGLEVNRKTNTLSFFIDYYKGKDLDRQVQMLRGAAERFAETQIIEIAYQIAVALEFCHSRNILHQDIKPMNVLLREPWNPMTQRDVPDLFVADFGIASRVQTIGTRLTEQRGTPGYEAPEIRGQEHQAAFSQKSDVYAFGCILYRLCTLSNPVILDDIKPCDISANYSIELLSLISSMLSMERDERPTASAVKEQLATIGFQALTTATLHCAACHETFPSRNQLVKHLKKTGHRRPQGMHSKPANDPASSDTGLRIHGVADAPAVYHYDENGTEDIVNPSPCVVCMRHFNSKKQFFGHLGGVRHWRAPKYVRKRRAEIDPKLDAEHHEKRLEKWIQKDMARHDASEPPNGQEIPIAVY